MARTWKPEEYEYQQEYIKTHIKFVNIPFNMTKRDDVAIYDYLNCIEEKKAAYIKKLIQGDMNARKYMKYRIKPEYVHLWGEDATEETVLTEEELEAILRGWGMTFDAVKDQLIEIDEAEPQEYPPTRYSETLYGCSDCKHELACKEATCPHCGKRIKWD